MSRKIAWPVLFLTGVLVLMWGLSWPVYKFGLHYTPPLLFAGMRTILGGLVLLVVALPRWKELRWKERWPIYVTSCFFNVILFFGLQTVGLVYLPSGLFSVLVYLEPVLVGILAWMWLGEPLTPRKIVGLVLGFLGVAACSWQRLSGNGSWAGTVLGLMVAVSWAIGTVYLKRVQNKVDPLWLVTVQCLLGGAVMTAAGSLTEHWSDIRWTAPFLATLAFGMFIGVSTSWLIWFRLVQMGQVSRVAAVTFLVPVISVAISAIFLHEPVTLSLFAGLVLIAGSIYLVNRPDTVSGAVPPETRMGRHDMGSA